MEEKEFYEGLTPTQAAEKCKKSMADVNQAIKDGADTFLAKEYTYLTIFCVLFAILLVCTVDMPWALKSSGESLWFPYTTFAFLIGAVTSMASGLIGMKIATITNFKVTAACSESKVAGFKVAFMGGQVLGFMLVGLALLILEILILSYKPSIVSGGPN